jgi:hypothetical protein
MTTKIAQKRERARIKTDQLVARLAQIIEADNAPKLPKGTMGLVLELSKRTPGAWLNQTRERLEAMLLEGTLAVGLSPEEYANVAVETLI